VAKCIQEHRKKEIPEVERLKEVLYHCDKYLFHKFKGEKVSFDQLVARIMDKRFGLQYKVLDDLKPTLHPSILVQDSKKDALYQKAAKFLKQRRDGENLSSGNEMENWQANPHCLRSIFQDPFKSREPRGPKLRKPKADGKIEKSEIHYQSQPIIPDSTDSFVKKTHVKIAPKPKLTLEEQKEKRFRDFTEKQKAQLRLYYKKENKAASQDYLLPFEAEEKFKTERTSPAVPLKSKLTQRRELSTGFQRRLKEEEQQCEKRNSMKFLLLLKNSGCDVAAEPRDLAFVKYGDAYYENVIRQELEQELKEKPTESTARRGGKGMPGSSRISQLST